MNKKLMSWATGLFLILLHFNINAQTISVQRDHWDTSYFQPQLNPNNYFTIKNGLDVNGKIILYGDTTNTSSYYYSSSLRIFDPQTNSINIIPYTADINDVGINTAATVKTNTVGLNYTFFGANSQYNYPALYRHNSTDNSVITDILNIGSPSMANGISGLCFYSPLSNHDSLTVFEKYDSGISVYRKHYNQTGYTNPGTSFSLDNIYSSIIFRDSLYVFGNLSGVQMLYKSGDGINFIQSNALSFLSYNVNDVDTLNGNLYVSTTDGEGMGQIWVSSDGNTFTSYYQNFNYALYTISPFRNQIWTGGRGMNGGRPSVHFLTQTVGDSTSVDTLGREGNVASQFKLIASNNALFFIGNYDDTYGTYSNVVYKLILPKAGFTNSATQFCTTTNFTLTSTSAYTDSLRWILDNNYHYASSPGSSAYMSFSPGTSGTHTVGLIAIGGMQHDTLTQVITITPDPVINPGTSFSICATHTVVLSATGANTYTWTGGVTNGVAFTPTATSVYTVMGTDANGCTGGDTIRVTVNPLPSVNAGTDIGKCANDANYALQAFTPSGGTWSGSGIIDVNIGIFSPTSVSTGTYNLIYTYTDGNSCSNKDTVVATVYTLPTVNAGTDQSICQGQNITLTASGNASTYNWSNSVSDGVPFSPASSNTYTLTGTDALGCQNTAQVIITVNMSPVVDGGADITICATQTIVLSGSGANSYVWDNGVTDGVAFTPTISGTYNVTGTDVNGCSANDFVNVMINSLPNVNAGVDISKCANSLNYALQAFTPSGGTWSGSGIIDVNIGIFSPTSVSTGTYNLIYTYTDGNSCTNKDTLIATVNNLPSVDAGLDQSVCLNQNITLTGTGSAISYTWTNGVTDGVSFSPSFTTKYFVTGSDANGCSKTDSVLITVNNNPFVNANSTGNGTFCAGSSVTLSGSGNASSYTWSNGVADGVAFTATITGLTTYTVTGTDANSCTNTSTISLMVISSKNLTGNVTNTTSIVSGNVVLFKYSSSLMKWDSINYSPINTSAYSFIGLDSSDYVVMAIPSSSSMQVTYAPSAISWQDAQVIHHGCTNNSSANITVQDFSTIGTGGGSISGVIREGIGYGLKDGPNKPMAPGNPIPGVVVKGGKNPGAAIFSQTTTDQNGKYSFTNLPAGNYFILVDIAGLDTNGTYHIVVNENSNDSLNFMVDDQYVNPVLGNVATFVQSSEIENSSVNVYPNPAQQDFNIEYNLLSESNVSIDMMDILGNHLSSVQDKQKMSKGFYKYHISSAGLIPGAYFIRLTINNHSSMIKVFVTN